jgi:HPr kinase/phosphorylase
MGGVTLGDLVEGSEKRLGLFVPIGPFPRKREISHAEIQHCGGRSGPFSLSPDAVAIMAPEFLSDLIETPRRQWRHLLWDILESNPSCIFLSRNQRPPKLLRSLFQSRGIATLTSCYDEHLLESRLIGLLKEKLFRMTTLHGVLVSKTGQGIAITGESGSGKTACALKLMERGYRWVADDIIRIERRNPARLQGGGHGLTRRNLEIKGRGIVDVRSVFGPEYLCEETFIDLFVQLDGSHGEDKGDSVAEGFIEILGVRLPHYKIPAALSAEEIARRIDFIACGLRKSGGYP